MKYELPDRLKEKPEYADLNQSGTTPAAFIQNVASPDAEKTHQFAWAPSEKEIARAKNPDASPEAWASLLTAEELSSGDLTTEQRATNVAVSTKASTTPKPASKIGNGGRSMHRPNKSTDNRDSLESGEHW